MKRSDAKKKTITRIGEMQEGNFAIKNSPEAFRILSDGLYSDKEMAIVRELSCNARDANVAAGKDGEPITIHLPTHLEPWFSVTDNGVGLSHDDVMTVYTTYFESTKTESNAYIGALGLGSKSPFSYGDQFTVAVRFDGTKRTYSAFISENGVPAIALMNEQETDESNGLEVSLPVKEEDFRTFEQKVRVALKRFDPLPTIIGHDDFEMESVEYVVEGAGWRIRKSNNYYDKERSTAIQGSVVYPIDSDAMKDLDDGQRTLLSMPLDMDFEIGDLDVAASREALGYDKNTIANIKARLDVVLTELPKQFEQDFKDCKTLWDAKLKWHELFGYSGSAPQGLREIAKTKSFKLEWNGQKLDGNFNLTLDEKIDGKKNKLYGLRIVKFEKARTQFRGREHTADYNGQMSFTPSTSYVFMFDDLNRGSHKRVSAWLEKQRDSVDKDKRVSKVYLLKNLKAEFKKALGGVDINDVSTLSKPVTQATGVKNHGVIVREWNGTNYSHNPRGDWTDTSHDMDVGGFYVEISRYKTYRNGVELDMKPIVDTAADNGIVDLKSKTIYGLNPRWIKAIPKCKGTWINVFDYIEAELTKQVTASNLAQDIANFEAHTKFNWHFSFDGYGETLSKTGFTKADSTFKAFFVARETMKNGNKSKSLEKLQKVASKLNYKLPDATPSHDLDALWTTLIKKYPMVEFVNARDLYDNAAMAKLVEYVNLIDTK